MDPTLSGIIAEVVGAAVVRTAGWAGSGARQLYRRRGKKLPPFSPPAKESTAANLPDAALLSLAAFLRSSEFAMVAALYARAGLAAKNNQGATELLSIANRTLSEGLVLALEQHATGELCRELEFVLLTEMQESVGTVANSFGFSPALDDELRKSAAALVAMRSDGLLGRLGLASRTQYEAFADEYCVLVAAKYANMSLPHAGTTRRVSYARLFVEPLIELVAGPDREVSPEGSPSTKVFEALRHSTRLVILGNPGGGKSTISAKLVFDTASSQSSVHRHVPFLVTLRDFAPHLSGTDRLSLTEYMEMVCKSPLAITPPDGALEHLFTTGRGMVVFDGLDELLETSLRQKVVEAVEGFSYRYPLTPILVTSRRVGYEQAPLDPDMFPVAHLGDFNPEQVEKYASNWFALDETIEPEQRASLTSSFIADSRFVEDLRVNPLMLSLMCGIYATERYIPKNRPDVYDKCANLLLDQWDKQRGIELALPFDAHVRKAMRVLALHMYQNSSGSGLARADLIKFMTDYLLEKRFKSREDAEDAATQFLDFCKGRAWVLSEVGTDVYNFTHRTFLEYFAASQLVLEHTSASLLYSELRYEIAQGGASVVHQLAVQILGSSTEDGSEDFFRLVLDDVKRDGMDDWGAHRLLFLVRALSFMVPHPAVVDDLAAQLLRVMIRMNDTDVATQRRGGLVGVGRDLGAVARENAGSMRDGLRAAFEKEFRGDHRTSALSVALWLEVVDAGHYVGTSQWDEWTTQLRSDVLDEAVVDSSSSLWAAAELAAEGRMTVAKFVELHGFEGVYRFDPSSSPFVEMLPLLLRLGSTGDYRLEQLVTREGSAQRIADFILASPSRRALGSEFLATWADTVFMESAPSRHVLVFYLPVVEARVRAGEGSRGIADHLPAWVKDLAALRKGSLVSGTPALQRILDSDDAVSRVLREWMSRTRSFVSSGVVHGDGVVPIRAADLPAHRIR